jgi:hypothetical protein
MQIDANGIGNLFMKYGVEKKNSKNTEIWKDFVSFLLGIG